MPFFIVYDPPWPGNSPYLIGDRKGSREKQFNSYSMAAYRLRQCGRSARNCSTIREFDCMADATSFVVHERYVRRQAMINNVVVTTKKKPPEGGLLAHRVVGDQSVGLPELAVPLVSVEPVLVDEPESVEPDDEPEA